jgi:hypothetical protein
MVGELMLPSDTSLPTGGERRRAERHHCRPDILCRVVDLLDESVTEAGPWNVSAGGVCLLVEPHYPTGTPLEVRLLNPRAGPSLRLFTEVVHTLLVPSLREMYLTGCAVRGEPLSEEVLQLCI